MKKIIAIAVILAGVVLLTIGNTIQMYSTISIIENRLAEKEHAVDTVSVKVDTITFEQEIAIVDSAIKAEEGIVYKSIYDVPNVEYDAGRRWFQTLVRYPNGIPKILAGVSTNSSSTEFSIHGFFFLFMDEYGRELAAGEHSPKSGKWRWYCRTSNPGDVDQKYFVFKNPNLCRNIAKKKYFFWKTS